MSEKDKQAPVTKPEDGAVQSSARDVDAFLAEVKARVPAQTGGAPGRLIFAMDATMSRQPTWDRACQLQGEMFAETDRIGGLSVQLIYFRGFRECRSSRWVENATALADLMTQVDCRGGHTQIGRVLKHVRNENKRARVNAVVYVGDCMEEKIDTLSAVAGELGLMSVPVFMFQEGDDPVARQAFEEIARLTGGAYCAFDANSAKQLKQLLSAVAVYAAGGRKALTELGGDKARTARLLLEQIKPER
jgi:hypothetical protein